MDRFWDVKNNYPDAVLKEFNHWVAEVSYAQHTFGNFIVFCKREGVEKLSDLTDIEIIELKTALGEIERALSKNETFKPDRFNYWQMGNVVHHLHVHGIPRYKAEREFLGRVWKDQNPGAPVLWTEQKQDRATMVALREEIVKFLN